MSGVRADKWLWAARFWKTRSQAAAALREGAVTVAGIRADPATLLKVGDALVVKAPSGRKIIQVRALGEVRGGAELARLLYDDLTPPEPTEAPSGLRERGAGRPTKRDRRDIGRWKGEVEE